MEKSRFSHVLAYARAPMLIAAAIVLAGSAFTHAQPIRGQVGESASRGGQVIKIKCDFNGKQTRRCNTMQ
jgi:hypothetical protein